MNFFIFESPLLLFARSTICLPRSKRSRRDLSAFSPGITQVLRTQKIEGRIVASSAGKHPRRTLRLVGMFFHSSETPPERSADPAVRRANMTRITRLFAPYKLRLGGVLVLIVVSAALGVVPAFLLRNVLEAISRNDTTSLSINAAGMIAIAVATGVLGVIQTLLSNQVGQRVMHDLRAAVFRHLQRLSLAFFTRTRTGEVQSRISNDIGGVQNVVTNTATSIASNVTTVVATMVGMLVLS